MPNYNQSHIYKLCCKDTEIKEIYIGSTINFTRRKCAHKTDCHNINSDKYHLKVYQFIRENGGWENWTMILIEKVNVDCKLELLNIERSFIEELKPSLNQQIPSRTREEFKREYWVKNKEQINEKRRAYSVKNKEQINKKRREHYDKNKEKLNIKVTCECGCEVTKRGLTRHKKTEKHLKLVGLHN